MRGHINNQYVNREQICPFLLRIFIKEDGFHNLKEFSGRDIAPINDEIQVYTWRNSTLKEITNLIKESHIGSRNRESKFEFIFVFPDSNGVFRSRYLGTVYSNKKTDDDFLTLDSLNFNHQYIDISLTIPITPSLSNTSVSPTLSNTSTTSN